MNNENQNTNLVAQSQGDVAPVNLLESLTNSQNALFCTIKDDGTRESKKKIYNAISNVTAAIGDVIGETLEVTNVIAHPITIVDEQSGEVIDALRTVLITKDGKAYDGVSQGITNALSRIFSIMGMPPWDDEPVKMKIKQVKTRNGNNKVNTIELV